MESAYQLELELLDDAMVALLRQPKLKDEMLSSFIQKVKSSVELLPKRTKSNQDLEISLIGLAMQIMSWKLIIEIKEELV